MTADEECIHGLGPVAACVVCNGRAQRESTEERERRRTFPAKYPGQCRECNLPIHVGQIIAWRPDEAPIHEGCV